MIDRPGRGLLRRGSGGARTGGGQGGGGRGGPRGASGGFLSPGPGGHGPGEGGGEGGGGRGGGRAGHRRFSFGGPWRPVPAEGRRARKSRSHTYIYGGGHGVMLLQTAAVCPNGAPRSSTTRRQRPLPGAAKRCIFIFVMAAAH